MAQIGVPIDITKPENYYSEEFGQAFKIKIGDNNTFPLHVYFCSQNEEIYTLDGFFWETKMDSPKNLKLHNHLIKEEKTMTVKVYVKKSEQIYSYPRLKKFKNSESIVLFCENNTGIVLYSDGSHCGGCFCKNLIESDFEDFHGEVIISNA